MCMYALLLSSIHTCTFQNTHAGFPYIPSTRVQYKPVDVRTDSKVRYILCLAVPVTLPFRVSRHGALPKPTVIVTSTTVVLQYPAI